MLRLVKLELKYQQQLNEMMDEWTASKEKIIPWSIRKCDYHNFETYLNALEEKKESEERFRIQHFSVLIRNAIFL